MTSKTDLQVVVDTQWLNDRLHDPNVRIVEAEMSPDHYQDAHIPGAVFWNIMADLLLPDLRQNLDANHIERLLSRSGITNETTVVAHGSYPGTGAWIFWLLKLFEHSDVRVLDGGHQKWTAEGRPVTYLTLNEDGTFKSVSELQKLFTSRGITLDKEIFPYCVLGGRSAYTWFVLKYLLGYPKVRNYDGSWNEWSRLPDALIEK